MRPSITEQLDGIRHVLGTVVAAQISDAYTADVLAGIIGTLETLGRWDEVPVFMRDDAVRTAALLASIGITTPPLPADLLDIAALIEHHGIVRAALEQAMPAVMAEDDARAAVVALFRERCSAFPLTNRRAGQQPVPPTRRP